MLTKYALVAIMVLCRMKAHFSLHLCFRHTGKLYRALPLEPAFL